MQDASATAGRWAKGRSGNPAGRKPGTGEVAQLRSAIAAHVPEIVAKLVAEAKRGDVAAARLLLERVVPPLKPIEEAAPIVLLGESLSAQGRAVLAAASSGSLSPGQATQLLAGLGNLAKLVETDELTARVAALESRRLG